MAIISSLLDTDLYKLSMMQGVLHQFPGAEVEYAFKCRNNTEYPLEDIAIEVKEEIKHLCTLRFTDDELKYLSTIRYFKKDFIEFLKYFQLDENNVDISTGVGGFQLKIKGSWLSTILFEVPILAIINEVYFRKMKFNEFIANHNLDKKIEFIKKNPFTLIEFGTRRRHSKVWHRFVLNKLKQEIPELLFGTSNLLFAKEMNLRPIGTHAHEWFCACQQLGPRLIDSQKFALQKWADEYRGDLGIALSDCVGSDAFFRDFDMYFAKLFDGVRHDSGNPFEFGEKTIKHYESMRIDPKTKAIVFSDSLDFKKASELNERFKDRIKVSFGVGTNITNDVGNDPLQVVIKMTTCNGSHVAKLSDSLGKTMCEDNEYISYLKKVFNVK